MLDLAKKSSEPVAVDVGGRLSSVYQMMAVGLALAGAVGYWTSQTQSLMALAKTGMGTLVIFVAQILLIVFLGKIIKKWGVQAGAIVFFVIAATMGFSMAPIVHAYTGASIARAFGIACLVLGVASVYGNSTKRSLASMGGFMFVGLIGLIIAGIVNAFVQSSVMQMVLDVIAIVVFTGLAAWDTQRIRNELTVASPEEADRIVVFGALSMWLNMVNLFSSILSLTGSDD